MASFDEQEFLIFHSWVFFIFFFNSYEFYILFKTSSSLQILGKSFAIASLLIIPVGCPTASH